MSTITSITRQELEDIGFRPDGSQLLPAQRKNPGNLPNDLPADQTAVKIIPRKKNVRSIAAAAEKRLLKAAAYCRVSTLMESQETSISAQRRHYDQLIRSHPEWELADIYLEAGVTGTKAETRPELQRLIADCKAGKVNLILTKSISRFSRNTSDCIEMVRMLTSLGVDIFFEKENIHTGSMESEFMLSILACLAEEESRSISGNMKWGLRKRFENSTYKNPVTAYGYTRNGSSLQINEEEAKVVRGVFDSVLSGKGMDTIARELNGRGIPSPSGKQWTQSVLRQMIYNPVYVGDMLYQKSYMDETYRQRPNRGELDQYYHRNHHEAIISRKIFARAAFATHQRGKECGIYTEEDNKKQPQKKQNRYVFTGKLICADCGGRMYRQGKGYFPKVICSEKRKNRGGCGNGSELEDSIKNAFLTVLNKLAYVQRLAPRNRLIDRYIDIVNKKELEKNPRIHPEAPVAAAAAAVKLKNFVSKWRITGETADFPDDVFLEFVEKAEVASDRYVTFRFYCGMELTETIGRQDG